MTFYFSRDGITYLVSTEVGEGRLTDVVVQEDKQDVESLEVSE